jgi:hypothetical protein
MSAKSGKANRPETGHARQAKARWVEEYGFRPRKLESYYDPENDYYFAEATDEFEVEPSDIEWFENAEGDTIDDMSSALNESQRRAVRWRISALRGIGVLNSIALLAGCLPCWILMLRWNRESLLNEKELTYCDSLWHQVGADNFNDYSCVFYRHELSTYTAFVGLWMFGTLLQSFFMVFTSWRLHNKSFQAVVSIWTFVFMVVGTAVSIYTVTNLNLMAEDFNWRLAAPELRIAQRPGDMKTVLSLSIRAFLGLLYGLILSQAIWMWLMHQVLQFGLNLQEFGTEICGDRIESAAAENAIAMHSVIGRLLDHDELEQDSHTSRIASGHYHIRSSRDRNSHHYRDISEEDFQKLDYDLENEIDHDGVAHGDHDDDENDPNPSSTDEPSLNSVMALMTTLTSTMSALNHKIDAIESRVGDGTALLVMPPGENQWDARKS